MLLLLPCACWVLLPPPSPTHTHTDHQRQRTTTTELRHPPARGGARGAAGRGPHPRAVPGDGGRGQGVSTVVVPCLGVVFGRVACVYGGRFMSCPGVRRLVGIHRLVNVGLTGWVGSIDR